MANIQLNPTVNEFINTSLEDDVNAQKLARATVVRYSNSGSFCQKVKNFFLSIVWCSDWQKTKRLLKKRELREIKIKLLQKEGAKTEKFKKIMSDIKKQTNSLMDAEHEYMLKNFVNLQNNNPNPEIQAKLKKYNDKILNKIVEIDPRLKDL